MNKKKLINNENTFYNDIRTILQKGYTLCSQLSWSHIHLILPMEKELKAESERGIRLIEKYQIGYEL